MWSTSDVTFELHDDLSGDQVATVAFRTPWGTVWVMGEPHEGGRELWVTNVHIQGVRIGANAIGASNLRVMADVVMRDLDDDVIIVQGAGRTSGANPSRRPGLLRFSRRRGPAAGL